MHPTQAFDFKHTLPENRKLEFLNIVPASFTKLETARMIGLALPNMKFP